MYDVGAKEVLAKLLPVVDNFERGLDALSEEEKEGEMCIRDRGGTGLGLAITRNVILMHKGSIRVHSKEGEGSTFIIRIPLNYIG